MVSASTERAGAEEAQEAESFDEFFRREYSSIARALVLLVGTEADAEELAQEAFARAYERWSRVAQMESPAGYVYRTAFNLNRKRLRHVARPLRDRRVPQLGPDPALEVEIRSEIRRALSALPARQREALLLVEWLGMSADEAGLLLGIEAVSVRGRVHRARETIRRRLGGDG